MRKIITRLKQRLIVLLTSELSVSKLALSITLGLLVGIVPFFLGLNIFLSFLVAWRLKLNHVLLQFISNLAYPIQVLLFVPFLKAGNYIFSAAHVEVSAKIITNALRSDFVRGMQIFGMWNLWGIVLWLIITIPAAYLLYQITYSLILKYRILPAQVIEKETIRPSIFALIFKRSAVSY